MNNSSFIHKDDATKFNDLVAVLNKRCRGFIKYDVLSSIVSRLDCRRQYNIEVVNKATFIEESKMVTTMNFNNGEINNVEIRCCRCLLGRVDFGKEVTTVEDGIKTILSSSVAKIITYPAIVLIEEQDLGNIDLKSTGLLIYF